MEQTILTANKEKVLDNISFILKCAKEFETSKQYSANCRTLVEKLGTSIGVFRKFNAPKITSEQVKKLQNEVYSIWDAGILEAPYFINDPDSIGTEWAMNYNEYKTMINEYNANPKNTVKAVLCDEQSWNTEQKVQEAIALYYQNDDVDNSLSDEFVDELVGRAEERDYVRHREQLESGFF